MRCILLPDGGVGGVAPGVDIEAEAARLGGVVVNVEALPVEAVTSAQVNAERDRRISAGFEFEGVVYQTRIGDRENIAGASQLAFQAVVLETPWPEDYRWIAADDSRVPMTAHDVLRFAAAAARHKEAHIFAASDLKGMSTIPQDYTHNKWWPSSPASTQ